MYYSIISGAFHGMESYLIHVEVDVSDGLPCMDMVGYLAGEVKETRERVRVGIKNSGFRIPAKRITISLSPADIRKDGSAFDLPVAIGILGAMGELKVNEEFIKKPVLILGEMGLNGEVKPVKGIFPILLNAVEKGIHCCIVPNENMAEATAVENMIVYGTGSLKKTVAILNGSISKTILVETCNGMKIEHVDIKEKILDFSQVCGQETAKRAAEIAAAGFHNLLLFGPPGSGKSMIAERLPTIMPKLTTKESIEVTKIGSMAGRIDAKTGMIRIRPFLQPHHSASVAALVGGGTIPKPGMVTLAHKGILFLDELPEFGRKKLDLLRQPIEDGRVQIAKNHYTCTYPADFLLVCAMNPCPCGYFPDKKCKCTPHEVSQYLKHISGPLVDRIDISVEVGKIKWDQIHDKKPAESSTDIAMRVDSAIRLQRKRYSKLGEIYNSDLTNELVTKFCIMSKKAEQTLQRAYDRFELSPRSLGRIKKVARTIADLDQNELISDIHICEAISLNKGIWHLLEERQ